MGSYTVYTDDLILGTGGNFLGSESFDFTIVEENTTGCTDPNATNYDPEAGIDDGTCYLLGDLNGDEEINILDIIWLMNDILDGDDECNNPAGDLSGDESCDITDIVLLVNSILDDDKAHEPLGVSDIF